MSQLSPKVKPASVRSSDVKSVTAESKRSCCTTVPTARAAWARSPDSVPSTVKEPFVGEPSFAAQPAADTADATSRAERATAATFGATGFTPLRPADCPACPAGARRVPFVSFPLSFPAAYMANLLDRGACKAHRILIRTIIRTRMYTRSYANLRFSRQMGPRERLSVSWAQRQQDWRSPPCAVSADSPKLTRKACPR